MTFTFSRPKSHYGSGRNAGIVKASAPKWHISSPDVDNLVKFVLDALNGRFWLDDKCIVYLKATKSYGYKPGVKVTVMDVDEISYVDPY